MHTPDEDYMGCPQLRAAHNAHTTSARASRKYDPHCHLTKGYEQVHSLRELQVLVSTHLGMPCPLSGLALLSEATGHERVKELASYLHVPYQKITLERKVRLHRDIIPGLRLVRKHILESELPLEHHARD